jgi:uncharacterized membrane protein YphA (DoxX/SURF4 family)
MRTILIGRGLLAIASAAVAILTVYGGASALLGESLPHWLPWRDVWVYGCALALLASSVGLCFGRSAMVSALVIAAYYLLWALTCIPTVMKAPLSVLAWYGFCEAVTSLVGPWILYILIERRSSGLTGADLRAVRVAQVLFGLTCIFYGGSHFAFAQYTAGMVPGWLPGRLEWAYLTGLGHIAAGLGIAVGVVPRLAALLEAAMMSLFGLLVWVPSFFMQPRPAWAGSPQGQWSELVVTLLLATSGWIVYSTIAGLPNFRRPREDIATPRSPRDP